MFYESSWCIRVTRKSKHNVKFVKVIAQCFIRPLLQGLMVGDLNEASLKLLETKSLNKTVKNGPVIPGDCKICGKTFASNHGLKIHMNLHTKTPQKEVFSLNVQPNQLLTAFECQICGRIMKTKLTFDKHTNEQHKTFLKTQKSPSVEEIVQYECDQCPFKVDLLCTLENHKKREHEDPTTSVAKRSNADPAEEALEKMKSLSVVEKEKEATQNEEKPHNNIEEMDFEVEKKRKREDTKKLEKIKKNVIHVSENYLTVENHW